MPNPCVTRDSSSLLISESLRAIWAVVSTRQPREQFVDDFLDPRGYLGCRLHESPVTAVR